MADNWTKTATATYRNGDPNCPQCERPWKGNHVWALGNLPMCDRSKVLTGKGSVIVVKENR